LADVPISVSPRVDPGVPVWALGPYSGPRRGAIIAAKERGRRDLADPIGLALARGIVTLRRWGELPASASLCLAPAPSRPRAARSRGGDPVLRAVRAAARAVGDGCGVCPALSMRRGVRDSVGLSAAARQENLAGRIRVSASAQQDLFAAGRAPGAVVLIDDVVTTGATATESVRAFATVGVRVAAVLVVAAA